MTKKTTTKARAPSKKMGKKINTPCQHNSTTSIAESTQSISDSLLQMDLDQCKSTVAALQQRMAQLDLQKINSPSQMNREPSCSHTISISRQNSVSSICPSLTCHKNTKMVDEKSRPVHADSILIKKEKTFALPPVMAKTKGSKARTQQFTCDFVSDATTGETCGRTFKSKGNLHVHRRKHTGERPYICNVNGCPQAFSTIGNMRDHQRRHFGIKPHSCTICGVKHYYRRYMLVKHIKRVHPHHQAPEIVKIPDHVVEDTVSETLQDSPKPEPFQKIQSQQLKVSIELDQFNQNKKVTESQENIFQTLLNLNQNVQQKSTQEDSAMAPLPPMDEEKSPKLAINQEDTTEVRQEMVAQVLRLGLQLECLKNLDDVYKAMTAPCHVQPSVPMITNIPSLPATGPATAASSAKTSPSPAPLNLKMTKLQAYLQDLQGDRDLLASHGVVTCPPHPMIQDQLIPSTPNTPASGNDAPCTCHKLYFCSNIEHYSQGEQSEETDPLDNIRLADMDPFKGL